MNCGNGREALAIAQAVHIDDGSCGGRHIRDRCDEHTATATDQKIAGAGSEAVILNQRPVISPNLEKSSGIRNHPWAMTATERARARPQRIVFRRLRKSNTHMNIAAVAAALMVHRPNFGTDSGSCQRWLRPASRTGKRRLQGALNAGGDMPGLARRNRVYSP
jgi:hypothetical protein